MPCSFWFKLSDIFDIALHSVHTQPDLAVLKLLTFKEPSKFEHENRKRTKMRHSLSTVNIVINENYML